MTFDGKFLSRKEKYFNDPSREKEIVYFLVNNKYGYLIKDHIKTIEDIYGIDI